MDSSPSDQSVLLVAQCRGHRCSALHGCTDGADAAGLLAQAVRERPRAVLTSVPCVGACSHGAVVLVGPAVAEPGRICWTERPWPIALAERAGRAASVAAWVRGGAPDVGALPAALRPPA